MENITAQRMDIQASNGDVTLNNVSAQVIINTENGMIHIEDGVGTGTFEATSGKLEIQYNDVTGDIEARTDNGEIQLSIPQTLSFQFNATTNRGNVKTAFAEFLTSSAESAHGTVGNNAEITISLSTSSGDIQVDFQ